MHETDRPVGQYLRQPFRRMLRTVAHRIHVLTVLYQGTYHINLPAVCALIVNKPVNPRTGFLTYRIGLNFLPSRRQFINDGNIQIPINQQGKGTGNGCGRHDQQMNIFAFFCQAGTLIDTKPVLLIHHRNRKVMEPYLLTEQCMGADCHRQSAIFHLLCDFPFFLCSQ